MQVSGPNPLGDTVEIGEKVQCLLDVERLEIGNEDYRILRSIGDKDVVTVTATLTGNIQNAEGGARVLMQVTVPFCTEMGSKLIEAKQYNDKLEVTLTL